MAIYIQQSPEEVRQSFSLQRRAEILNVRLSGASMDCHFQSHELRQGLSVGVGYKCKANLGDDGTLSTTIDFTLTGTPEEKGSTRVFTIECTFQVTYRLERDYLPTSQEIDAFAGANAVFNVWPYFREFTQNTALRMGLPVAPTVPFLKLVPRPEEKKEGLPAREPSREVVAKGEPQRQAVPRKSRTSTK
jgi:hypothetical protein